MIDFAFILLDLNVNQSYMKKFYNSISIISKLLVLLNAAIIYASQKKQNIHRDPFVSAICIKN